MGNSEKQQVQSSKLLGASNRTAVSRGIGKRLIVRIERSPSRFVLHSSQTYQMLASSWLGLTRQWFGAREILTVAELCNIILLYYYETLICRMYENCWRSSVLDKNRSMKTMIRSSSICA